MSDVRRLRAALVAALVLLAPLAAAAQIYDAVGNRAQGMGGAFVAVADDATATWWNPAGLAGGAYFSATLDVDRTQEPRSEVPLPPGGPGRWRFSASGLSAVYPALGLSYYRLRFSEIQPPASTAGGGASRQDHGLEGVRLVGFSAGQFGVTVGQSLGDHLVVATTLKLLRGSVAAQMVAPPAASLDAAANLEGEGETRGDLDLGLMASFGAWRIGAAVKNVSQPSFGNGTLVLTRQARAGASYTTGLLGHASAVTVAADADLTRTETLAGDVRHVGAGVESWFLERKVGVRAGASASTIGAARPVATGGASAAIRSGFYVDGFAVVGADAARRGWGLALRVTF